MKLIVEAVRGAMEVSRALGCDFQFPVAKTRVFPVDHPEILLIALLVIAAKLCFPFSTSNGKLGSTVFDWNKWANSRLICESQPSANPSMSDYSAEEIVSLSEDDLDQYFGEMAILNDIKSKLPSQTKTIHIINSLSF